MKLMLYKLSQGGHIIGVGALTEGEYGLLCGVTYLHVAASSFLQLPQPLPVDHLRSSTAHCIPTDFIIMEHSV